MVTREHLHEHLGRRPFRPFRVTLSSGEVIEVYRTAQGVATPRQFIVGVRGDNHFRWIPLNDIADVKADDTAA